MADESLSTPGMQKCNHNWKQVKGATGTKGGLILVCEKCDASKETTPLVGENQKDKRPLLME